MYNLIEHSNNYSKTSRSLWKYYRHEAALNYDGIIMTLFKMFWLIMFHLSPR